MKKRYITPALNVKKVETEGRILEGSLGIYETQATGSDGGWAKENDYDMGDEW